MGVLVSLTTRGSQSAPEKTRDLLQKLANDVRSRLSNWLFAEGRDTMEEVVGRELATRGLMLAVAESCTGGLIGHRLTQVAGSSAYVDRGAVCYSNRAKTEMLGVPAELIARHGAVSKEVAAAMACGIRERANVSVGLSVTGIAGPGGGTETKPVGLVYIGLDDGSGRPITREFRFHGDRNRHQTTVVTSRIGSSSPLVARQGLARIVHEHFCCNRRSAATTSLRPVGSPLGPSTYCWGLAPFFLAPVPVLEAGQAPPQTAEPVLQAPRAGLATRLRDFATNRHE